MSGEVGASAFRLSLPPAESGGPVLATGETVSAVVAARSGEQAIIELGGARYPVALSETIAAGARLTLRILGVSSTEIVLQLVGVKPPAQAAVAPPPAEPPEDVLIGAPSVAQVLRRFVDSATMRFFGSPNEIKPMPDMQRAVSSRGDLPLKSYVELDPNQTRSSAALRAATSEELLAAQAALERLDVPATPITVAAALPDANDPVRLSGVLMRLDTALASLSREGRLATLRTLASFISSISPDDEQASAQLSAFVDQVAIGSESKYVALLSALEERAQLPSAQRLPLTARATERATSLTHDLKTQLLSLMSQRSSDETLAPLLTEALEAVTAAQLTSLNAAREIPGALAFVLPVLVDGATLPAHITVQRDTPEGEKRKALDGRNFRVSLVIETRRLGTVTVRVEAIGGAMRLSFEAPTTRAADRLRGGFDRLSATVGKRGFRVVAINSSVVSRAVEKEQRGNFIPTVRGTTERREFIHVDTRA